MRGAMRVLKSQRGFSFLGLLLALVIVLILTVTFMKTVGIGGYTLTGEGGPNYDAMGIDRAKLRMRNLAQIETTYWNIHKRFGTWPELHQDMPELRGYTNRAVGGNATPYVPGYDFDIEASSDSFTITATPSPEAGMPEGASILRITENGRLEEVQPE